MKRLYRICCLACLILLINLSVLAQSVTKIVVFEAYSQEGILNPNIIIAQRYSGHCGTRSLGNPSRSDVWRCISNNMILDPCFQDGKTLACLISPWSNKATILELDKTLIKAPLRTINTQTGSPWALELANGQHCTFLPGASTVVNHLRVNYTCNDYKYSVLGQVNKKSALWKATLYDFKQHSIKEVPVTIAWF